MVCIVGRTRDKYGYSCFIFSSLVPRRHGLKIGDRGSNMNRWDWNRWNVRCCMLNWMRAWYLVSSIFRAESCSVNVRDIEILEVQQIFSFRNDSLNDLSLSKQTPKTNVRMFVEWIKWNCSQVDRLSTKHYKRNSAI